MKPKTIVFYAPVGTDLPPHRIGGGEIGCRRTREILKNDGYTVITVDKPTMGHGALRYIVSAMKGYVRIWKHLLSGRESLLYVVGFYEKNIYLEWLILMTGLLLRRKTIYEARNGRLVEAYWQYGTLYRKMMDGVLGRAHAIFCQGLEYVDFIERYYQRASVYTPNYVLDKYVREYNGNRPLDVVKLIYVGRVTESKNIAVVIDVCGRLLSRGYETETVIIGGYTDEYRAELDRRIAGLNMPENAVRFLGPQPFESIREELQRAHFFIFPSQEKKEGHSNALTEAMTFGVVPIASAAGFNRSILGKPELIMADFSAETYADAIVDIVERDAWKEYSLYMYRRAKENYSEEIVRNSILTTVRTVSG